MDDGNERINRRLQQLAAAAEPTFWGYLGCEFVSMKDNIITIALDAKPHHLNPIGMVHGGVTIFLAGHRDGDCCDDRARPEEKVVTTNLNVHFVAPLYEGRLLVTAELVHQSRKMITTQGRVVDREGNLGTMGTGTFRVI